MIVLKNYHHSVETNQNPKWPYIHDHPYRILIIAGSGSGKINVLLNLIKIRQHLIMQQRSIRIKVSTTY